MRFRRQLACRLFDVDPKTVWPQCLLTDTETRKEMRTRAANHENSMIPVFALSLPDCHERHSHIAASLNRLGLPFELVNGID